ncbi:hypothetical protein ALC60_09314 [Trachymyrmex zeteki]|uniref:Uncharacterized protein n=1 Tax=Mycetomoellerius zeteki TaxID=64791 RepID=A0A151WUP3_9HYME|nr:hypothetical protein ALC60_09314 [Trachymyrmex zeteki]
MEARFSEGVELRDSKETRRALRRDWGGIALSAKEEILRKNLTSHQFPERARTHQLRGISTVSHFLNVGQMCRDVRRRTVEGVDPKTWYGRVVTSVGGLRGGGGGEKRKRKKGASDLEAYQIVIVGNRRLIYHGNASYPSLKAPPWNDSTSLFLETRGFAV